MKELPPEHPGAQETPFETITKSDTLPSRFVDPRLPRTIRGYDLAADLMQHYRFSELVFLSLTGVLPDERTGLVMELALLALSPVHAGEADANVAVLGSVVGADVASLIASAAVTVTEVAREFVDAHEDWREALAAQAPATERWTASEQEQDDVSWLFSKLSEHDVQVPEGVTWKATALAALWAIGLESREQWIAAVVVARLPLTIGEGLASELAISTYPNNVPRFRYVDSKR